MAERKGVRMISGHDAIEDLQELATLAHWLGEPSRQLVILGEGNVSKVLEPGILAVSASGTQLHTMNPKEFVILDYRDTIEFVTGNCPVTDSKTRRIATESRIGGAIRPSIEFSLHAVLAEFGAGKFVAHTHPTVLNGLLCSDNAHVLTKGILFPDQTVVCGAHPLFIEYANPGVELARLTVRRLKEHLDAHGVPPRLVLLQNHGIAVLGESAIDIKNITEMAVKVAQIASATLAVGQPRFLPRGDVDRLNSREDESYRMSVLRAVRTSGPHG